MADPSAPKGEPPKSIRDTLQQIADAAETIALANPGLLAPAAAPGTGGALDLARVAETGIARLLGGSVDGNAGRLMQRLAQVFPAKSNTDGSTTYGYRPVGAQPVDSQNGVLVSGAQAVFYQQGRTLAGSIHDLLDNLEPVVTAADDEDIASLVALFRATTDDVVEEFGRDGGAVLPRIKAAKLILEDTFRQLSIKLGLKDARADETRELDVLQLDLINETMTMLGHLTNQLTGPLLEQYVSRVVRGVGASFVRLSWTVRAIPAALDQVVAEFDALRVNAADRMLLWLRGDENFSVEQALQWCRDTSTQSWPSRLDDGRRADLTAVKIEAGNLQDVLSGLLRDGVTSPLRALVGTARLVAALQELVDLLHLVVSETTNVLAKAPKPGAARLPTVGH